MSTLFLVFFQLWLNLYENLITNLGRDITLTSRVEIWEELIKMDTDPWTGTGYDSFWLGDRAEKLWEKYWWHPNQAHNGYLEIYLNQGWIGLVLFIGLIVVTYKNIIKGLNINYNYGAFRMSFLIMAMAYNYTEAGFKGLHLVFFIFLLIAFEYPITLNNGFAEDLREMNYK